MRKRFTALLLCALFTATLLTACANNGSSQHVTQNQVQTTVKQRIDTSSFRLCYSKSDSLDPFKSETLNNQVVEELVYDSLFVLDESYEAVPQIAESYSYQDAQTLSVTLKTGLRFSDGSSLDAENIVYSFQQAKESPRWETTLAGIGSAEMDSPYQVTFRLYEPNPNAHKLLTFAVARAKEDENDFKIGSGRYKFTNVEGDVVLQQNESHPDFAPHFKKITLVNITSGESVENALNIGNISFAFRDLADSTKTKVTAAQKNIILNNLVYLGINSTDGITANANIRRAINLAVNRDTLVKSVYLGYARSAKSIFNPASSLGKQTEIFQTAADLTAAKQAISIADYDRADLKLKLLCDKNEGRRATAQLVAQQLTAAGFQVEIDEQAGDSYRQKVQGYAFDIYIGEIKLRGDMGLQSFFTADGATHYGILQEEGSTAESYGSYLKGESEIGTFILDFSQEVPFVPLLYREGMICYTKSLQGDMQGYDGNHFSNIEDWYYN